ncbi:sensor histidine kinase [Virgibacillus sp. W0430]|uniref:sensor histidine kinase n=1 Tax=Virgibacillus sp. W0430 TaxID=3391580 RepID=UPI003F487A10
MRTLYVRVFITTMGIMIASALMAFIAANMYYQQAVKPKNDQKVTEIAQSIAQVMEESGRDKFASYLHAMTDLGYQFYLVHEDGDHQTFGKPFRTYDLKDAQIDTVLSGNVYHGIATFPWQLFVTGFFDNELKNTVGVPVKVEGEAYALFVRPNTLQQFGEMREFLTVLLLLLLFFSFLFVLWSTRYIVTPIRKLTKATRKIAAGNYHIKLTTKRRDEIGRLANDFSRMSNSLSRMEEKRQEFVSNVSHEIQSPLTSIQGFSQALQEEGLSDAERQRYSKIIEKESRRLSLLSRQLLTLSFLERVEAQAKTTFDLSDQLKEVVATTEWQQRDKEIAIIVDTPSAIIQADKKLLYQVWLNLITNAIHYTPKGGNITIRLEVLSGTVNVFIEDTGVGIDAADMPYIFDRFYKVDRSRKRTEASAGLGLAITKKIIELHAGTIEVTSEKGKGSTFIVSLPK